MTAEFEVARELADIDADESFEAGPEECVACRRVRVLNWLGECVSCEQERKERLRTDVPYRPLCYAGVQDGGKPHPMPCWHAESPGEKDEIEGSFAP